MVEPRAHRDFLAEIAREIDDGDARVGAVEFDEQAHRRVTTTVVDVDDFGIEVGGERIQHRGEPLVEFRQHRLLVAHRHDHRQRVPGGEGLGGVQKVHARLAK